MKLEDLAHQSSAWLRGVGPESDIVISSRIRLARNLAEFPFIRRATEHDRAAVERALHNRIQESADLAGILYLDVSKLPGVDRQFLVERQLISRELAESSGARAVAIDAQENFSLMINEEDHLRMQVIRSGLDLNSAWEQIDRIDTMIEKKVTFAFHEKYGYLTACPTNVGTGMRVSVMLHLPALVITRQIEKVFRSLQKINLAVRGLYGEGSQAMGDFYQISNQITLGRTEAELIQQVADVVPVLIDYERRAREFLVRESQRDLHDRVSRAYGILCTAQTISSEETMHLLSSVR
ncbi:MAG: protein arginine kinase, partial [Planctomycetales bacterium]|nr:protein arginine kinase [Planctomycetales bacterium]